MRPVLQQPQYQACHSLPHHSHLLPSHPRAEAPNVLREPAWKCCPLPLSSLLWYPPSLAASSSAVGCYPGRIWNLAYSFLCRSEEREGDGVEERPQ